MQSHEAAVLGWSCVSRDECTRLGLSQPKCRLWGGEGSSRGSPASGQVQTPSSHIFPCWPCEPQGFLMGSPVRSCLPRAGRGGMLSCQWRKEPTMCRTCPGVQVPPQMRRAWGLRRRRTVCVTQPRTGGHGDRARASLWGGLPLCQGWSGVRGGEGTEFPPGSCS